MKRLHTVSATLIGGLAGLAHEALSSMRLTKIRVRFAALVSAVALAVGLGVVSVPQAQASVVLHQICSKTYKINGKPACLDDNGLQYFYVKASVDKYYEYEVAYSNGQLTGDCLQTNVADTTLAFGECVQNPRQYFWWDNESLLVNLYYFTEAYITDGGSIGMGCFECSLPNDAWSIN